MGEDARKAFPRVLQILPAFNKGGGVERGTLDIAEALLDQGIPPFVASAGGDLAALLTKKGGIHIDLPLNSKNPLVIMKNIGRLQRAICRHQIDILHVRSRAPAWSALIAAQKLDIPLITTYHAPYNASSFFKKKYNAVMARGSHVIAISEFISRHINQQYGTAHWFGKNHISVIPRGIDTHFFSLSAVCEKAKKVFREEWMLPRHAKIILLPGRLTRWKGQKILIQAVSRLSLPDIYVVFVGNTQGREGYLRELQKEVSRLDLGDRIRFVPSTLDMPVLYALATLVVSASTDPEGFGRIIAEAGAMMRPVIATNHGAAPEIVLPDETGWLIPPRNVLALRDCLEKALSLPENHLKSMGERAHRHILNNFSQEVFCQKTLNVYAEIGRRKKETLPQCAGRQGTEELQGQR